MSIQRADDEERFRDPRTHIYTLAVPGILVVCPRCTGAAVVRPHDDGTPHSPSRPRRLICSTCTYADTWTGSTSRWGGPHDPFFGRPLWLQAPCCGGRTLWAFNREHLDLIDGYVRARIRERGHDLRYMSVLEKLPAWIKSADNRDEITRTIGRLRTKLSEVDTGTQKRP